MLFNSLFAILIVIENILPTISNYPNYFSEVLSEQ